MDRCNLVSSVENREWTVVYELLKSSLATLNTGKNGQDLSQDDAAALSEVLRTAVLDVKVKPECVLPAATECLRLLRNGCVNAPEFQMCIATQTSALDSTHELLRWLGDREGHPPSVLCIQVSVQFLGNTVVGNIENQALVWRKFLDTLIKFLNFHDVKVVNFTAMVIYNILLGCPDVVSGIETHGIQLIESLIDAAMKDSEFALFTLELFLRKERFLSDIYERVSVERRLSLLETVHGMLGEGRLDVPERAICFLAEQLKQRSDRILRTCEEQSVEQLEPREVTRLLELLASASGESPCLELLQQDTSLLVDCTFLLRSIHSLGKNGHNSFTSIQKLSELSLTSRSECLEEHPAFGFKVGLVRLLANLCWRNKCNQDKVREMDGIPLLLDCCNIDARNPLIIQWVVLAVRNLCEGNLDNQAVIAAMNREGIVDSAVLKEAGVNLHQEGDNKIIVVPYRQ